MQDVKFKSISGLVAEYIVAIDVTRARFPADAYTLLLKTEAAVAAVDKL